MTKDLCVFEIQKQIIFQYSLSITPIIHIIRSELEDTTLLLFPAYTCLLQAIRNKPKLKPMIIYNLDKQYSFKNILSYI